MAPEPATTDEDDLRSLDLPFLQRTILRAEVVLLAFVLRLTDLLLLAWRPRLLWAYLGIWWAEARHTPYRARRSFEVIRAQKTTGQRFREMIYGETPLWTSLWVLSHAGVGGKSRLVDLGAGRGRLLVGARWLGAEACGIELLFDHVKRVEKPLRRAGIRMLEADMTQVDLSEFTHVFTNWLAFSDDTKSRLVERFRACRPGTRIITVCDPIEAQDFVRLSRRWMIFTWGPEPVWTYAYRPGAAGAEPE